MHPLMTKRKAISHLSPHLPLLLDSLYPAFKACPHTHPTLPIATAKGQPRPGHPEPPWLPAAPAHPPSATLATCCYSLLGGLGGGCCSGCGCSGVSSSCPSRCLQPALADQEVVDAKCAGGF